ncbi:PLP-dependent aminotransferase family protein [Silvimonas soli]|uniref:MocR-like pyridoxine biosynthesis transcription factor PdxR n=1 Tax=Silvimonas soli TaxID=2980100 RepID=UPI0024B38B17|nr:PLP-dependent aminotransferase family protein [Silvimonas soli]
MRTSLLSDWLAQRLDKASVEPSYRQLQRLLREAILAHELPAGRKLPSSRMLATELGIARNTVIQVYEQLAVEGYLLAGTGSGTFVADSSPDQQMLGSAAAAPASSDSGEHLSQRGQRLIASAGVSRRQWGAFVPGVADVTRFPAAIWSRLQARHMRNPRPELLSYAPPGGHAPLREALADYLRNARSVRCEPEQIIITTGIHQSVDLAVRLLCDPGDAVWTEDPCYWGVRSVMQASGLQLKPIAVDAEGINPSPEDLATPPRMMLVTPSHQYPLGMVMSLARRRMLLEFARQRDCWIIEDDYDSEFRYANRPLMSLQGMDDADRVIYVGSFGKILYPGLRIGYLVVPPALAEPFAVALAELYREGQLLQQAVLSDFIAEGHFSSHIRRMRNVYGSRREILMQEISRHFGDAVSVRGDEAGLHLVATLPGHVDDRQIAQDALAAGIATRPLSSYYNQANAPERGLLLGYACVQDDDIARHFATLARVIEEHLQIHR